VALSPWISSTKTPDGFDATSEVNFTLLKRGGKLGQVIYH
jgi:hypothetical protein